MQLTPFQIKELQQAIANLQYGTILIKARDGKGIIEKHESERIEEDKKEKIEPIIKI